MVPFMSMAARKPQQNDPGQLVPFTFRIPEGLVNDLDAWVSEQNVHRRGAPLTRSDVIRGVLAWASKNKPEWEEGQHVLLIIDHRGQTLLRKPVSSISSTEMTFSDGVTTAQRKATFVGTKIERGQVISVFQAVPLESDVSRDAFDNWVKS